MFYIVILILFLLLLLNFKNDDKIFNNENLEFENLYVSKNTDLNNLHTISKFDKNKSFALKGLCSVYIFLHHMSYNFSNLYIFLEPLKYLAFFVVGLFFFISGYGQMMNYSNNKIKIKNLIKRILNIFIPFIIVVFISSLIFSVINRTDYLVELKNIIIIKTIPAFWYIYVYILITILAYIIFKNFDQKKSITILFVFCILYVITRILQLYIGKKPLKPRQNLGFFMSNFFIFYVVLCCVIWYN